MISNSFSIKSRQPVGCRRAFGRARLCIGADRPQGAVSPTVGVSFAAVKEKSNLGPAVLLMIAFALTRWPGLLPENFSAPTRWCFVRASIFRAEWRGGCLWRRWRVTDALLNVLYYGIAPVNAYTLVNYARTPASLGLAKDSPPIALGEPGGRQFAGSGSVLSRYQYGGLAANPEYAKSLAGWIQALTTGIPPILRRGCFSGNASEQRAVHRLFVGAMKLNEAAEAKTEEEAEPKEEPEDAKPEETKA